MCDDEFHVHDGDRILEVISSLAEKARSVGARIIYVRNNGSPGEPDEPGTPRWEIHSKVGPREGDVVLVPPSLSYLIQQFHIYILPCKDLLADICTETWWKGHVFAVGIM